MHCLLYETPLATHLHKVLAATNMKFRFLKDDLFADTFCQSQKHFIGRWDLIEPKTKEGTPLASQLCYLKRVPSSFY